ncbi:hypothetical protein FH972_026922 [Carpinus fangiana]|uniref:Gfo/Idh/MocA-like oxidoreductase N-terminal domain-containing protein n=1 Tax=Carpinus fangiana TaxID=176857 RepID=A0A5N6L7X8_9ROSI|nr:hypothetical protein FH972_026922 [Carpinus fangiana]
MDANGTWYGLMSQQAKSNEPTFRVIIIGAGERGKCYAKAIQNTNGVVAAVADPLPLKRIDLGSKYIWKTHDANPEQEFEDWKDFLSYEMIRRQRAAAGEAVEPGIDAAFICIQDSGHAEAIIGLAPLDLHIFSEKPLATNLNDCLDICASLLKDGPNTSPSRIFSIGHVLRYSPHNKQLRHMLLQDHCIGDILSIEHTEPVGYWHFSHSYVRGNWRRQSLSAPSLLTKSCHDIDFLLWLLSSPRNASSTEPPHEPATVTSQGHVGLFKKSRKPVAAGEATNCLSCPIETDCQYSAKKIYTEQQFKPGKTHNWPWPMSVVRSDIEELYLNKGPATAKQALLDELALDYDGKTPPREVESRNWFGRCVWESDNDVCDDQTVTMTWEDDVLPNHPHRLAKTAIFHMIAHTRDQCIRRGRVYGTTGELWYDSSCITVHSFITGQTDSFNIKLRGGGHGDGDDGLVEQFAAALEAAKSGAMTAEDAQKTHIGCTIEEVIRSHALVFAAEEGRQKRCIIDWPACRQKPGRLVHAGSICTSRSFPAYANINGNDDGCVLKSKCLLNVSHHKSARCAFWAKFSLTLGSSQPHQLHFCFGNTHFDGLPAISTPWGDPERLLCQEKSPDLAAPALVLPRPVSSRTCEATSTAGATEDGRHIYNHLAASVKLPHSQTSHQIYNQIIYYLPLVNMLFSTSLVGFLAAFAIASPIAEPLEARAAAVNRAAIVLQNITTIEKDATTLNTTLNKYANDAKLGFYDLIAIQSQSDKISSDINSTSGVANSSTVWTQAQSGGIYNETNNKLKPIVFQLLANLVRHKPAFQKGGLVSTVKTNLVKQRELSRQFGNALTAKAVEPWKSKSPALANSILAQFDSAIKTFSS